MTASEMEYAGQVSSQSLVPGHHMDIWVLASTGPSMSKARKRHKGEIARETQAPHLNTSAYRGDAKMPLGRSQLEERNRLPLGHSKTNNGGGGVGGRWEGSRRDRQDVDQPHEYI